MDKITGTVYIEENLYQVQPRIKFTSMGEIKTLRGVDISVTEDMTRVFYDTNLKPANVRGNASQPEEGVVILAGRKTSMELLPTIPGNLSKITIRRGATINIT